MGSTGYVLVVQQFLPVSIRYAMISAEKAPAVSGSVQCYD